MAQTVIEPGISEILDVDVNAEIPCYGLDEGHCSNPARWVWYLDCGATGNPVCDICSVYFAAAVMDHLGEECVCIPHHHTHLVAEIKCRRL